MPWAARASTRGAETPRAANVVVMEALRALSGGNQPLYALRRGRPAPPAADPCGSGRLSVPARPRPAHRGSIVGCACWWSRTRRASPTRSRSACAAEGFDVDIADNGTDGLWRARETAYAAIILDILLPGMNGFKVCRTLRDEGVWTPILMLTAKDGELDEAEALDTGADDFLSQAVLVRGARRPPARAAAARQHAPPDGAHGRQPHARSRRRGSAGGATPRSTSRRASTRCSSC